MSAGREGRRRGNDMHARQRSQQNPLLCKPRFLFDCTPDVYPELVMARQIEHARPRAHAGNGMATAWDERRARLVDEAHDYFVFERVTRTCRVVTDEARRRQRRLAQRSIGRRNRFERKRD